MLKQTAIRTAESSEPVGEWGPRLELFAVKLCRVPSVAIPTSWFAAPHPALRATFSPPGPRGTESATPAFCFVVPNRE